MNTSSGLATLQSVQISITVAGGAGQTLFTATGTISGCSMIPANDAAQYDFAMTAAGSDEYPVTGKSGIIGRVFLATRRDLLGDYWAKIYNATHDGAYKVRCIAVK